MKAFIWLGNTWLHRIWTRHNVWHIFIEHMSKKSWSIREIDFEMNCEIIHYDWMLYIKLHWCINDSGKLLKKVMTKYNFTNSDIVIVHDDIDIGIWKLKRKNNWHSWWHNWISDICKYIWEEFIHIKIWIGKPEKWIVLTQRLLSSFKNDELKNITSKFDEVLFLIPELKNITITHSA